VNDRSLEPGSSGHLVALPDGGALLVGRGHWAKHDSDLVEAFRLDPTSMTWRTSGAPCAAIGFNDSDGGSRTEAPCLLGGFVANLAGGGVLSAGPPYGTEFEFEPRAAAIFDSASGAWLKQTDLPRDYRYGTAIGLTDGTALIVSEALNEEGSQAIRFVPAP
jgi:hypothetical protein